MFSSNKNGKEVVSGPLCRPNARTSALSLICCVLVISVMSSILIPQPTCGCPGLLTSLFNRGMTPGMGMGMYPGMYPGMGMGMGMQQYPYNQGMNPYGQQNPQQQFGQPNQQNPYGQQNPQQQFAQPNQQNPYGQPNQQQQYAQPNQQNPYGQQGMG